MSSTSGLDYQLLHSICCDMLFGLKYMKKILGSHGPLCPGSHFENCCSRSVASLNVSKRWPSITPSPFIHSTTSIKRGLPSPSIWLAPWYSSYRKGSSHTWFFLFICQLSEWSGSLTSSVDDQRGLCCGARDGMALMCFSTAAIILYDVHIVSPVVSICISLITNDAKQLIQAGSWVLLTQSYCSLRASLLSGMTSSRFILDIFCLRPGINNSSNDTCFFLVGDNIQSLESGCQGYSLLLDWSLFLVLSGQQS